MFEAASPIIDEARVRAEGANAERKEIE